MQFERIGRTALAVVMTALCILADAPVARSVTVIDPNVEQYEGGAYYRRERLTCPSAIGPLQRWGREYSSNHQATCLYHAVCGANCAERDMTAVLTTATRWQAAFAGLTAERGFVQYRDEWRLGAARYAVRNGASSPTAVWAFPLHRRALIVQLTYPAGREQEARRFVRAAVEAQDAPRPPPLVQRPPLTDQPHYMACQHLQPIVDVSGPGLRPVAASDISRFYPDRAMRTETEGSVQLRCSIVAERLRDCRVEQQTVSDMGFGEAALRAAEATRIPSLIDRVEGARIDVRFHFGEPRPGRCVVDVAMP